MMNKSATRSPPRAPAGGAVTGPTAPGPARPAPPTCGRGRGAAGAKMARRRRGAGPLWALGLCLARVAGQLVEVRRGDAEGPGRLWPASRGLGKAHLPGSWLFPFQLSSQTWVMG